MKRFFALAALVLGLAACQTEPEGLNVNVDGEQLVTVNVTVPEAETRADVDKSAKGVFDNGILEGDATMRYILQVYYNGVASKERLVEYSDEKSVTFEVRLVPGRNYQFVVWADVVDTKDAEGKYVDKHYNTADLANITLNSTWVAMDESRDAFTATELIDNYNGAKGIEIKLYRPFAKLRVVTTDIKNLQNLGIKPTKATVAYSTDHRVAFDAYTGAAKAADDANRAHTEYTIATYPNEWNEDGTTKGTMTLFSDYFFAENDVTQFNFKVYDQNNELIKENSFVTDIYVKRNYLTTIKGNILTDGNSFEVEIKDAFAGELGTEDGETFANVDTAEELLEAINTGVENITLDGDIDLNDLLTAGTLSTRASEPALVVAAENTMTIDLNGYSISQTKTQTAAHSMITNKGTLTILDSKGNGKISYKDEGNGGEYVSNTIQNSGVLTIEGGIIENNSVEAVAANGYPHPIDNSGKLVINGGTFTNNANYSSMRIWCTTDDDTEVIINGGTFNGSIDLQSVNGNANKGVLTINGGTFNADTYTKSAVRFLGFGTDVDEIFGYINGGTFNAKIKLNNYVGGEFNSQVFFIKGGTFAEDPSEFVNDDYTVVETENGLWTVERKPDVAKIGEVGYTSLQKAVAAVKDGETITLARDIIFDENSRQSSGGTWYEGLYYIGNKSFTIDLNGKTISQNGAVNDYLFLFKNDTNTENTINFINGTLDAGTSAYCALCTSTTSTAKITINLENVNLNGNNSNGAVAKIRGGAELNVNAGTVITGADSYVGIEAYGATVNIYEGAEIYQNGKSSYAGSLVGVSGNGTVNVYGGKGTSAQGGFIAMTSGGTINVSGGEWTANTDGTYANDNKGVLIAQSASGAKSVVNVTGGTFKGGYNCYGDAAGDAQINIKGGNFNADPATYVAAGYKVVEENGIWTVVVDPAAKIGETEYASLQEAFNVGGEITLLRDITIAETVVLAEGKTVVLDLNGKTLAAVDKNTVKNNGGNLTLKNGTVTRTGDVVGYSVNNASGEINVVDATVERGLYTSGSKMTATNANISHEQSSRHAIYAWDCEVTINSGIFHNDNAGNATLMASGSSVVTINGGTFSIADGRSALGWTSSMIDQNSTAQVIVKGGLFNGGFRINSADTTLTIEGGEFNTNNGSSFTDYSGTKVVKGGKFTDTGAQNWAKKYIAEGYEMNANGEVVAK